MQRKKMARVDAFAEKRRTDRSIELLIEQIFHSISHIIPRDRITVGRVQLVFPARVQFRGYATIQFSVSRVAIT